MKEAARIGFPKTFDAALDFGCGVGRLTRALSRHFKQCVGLDISEVMIERARQLNRAFPGCDFKVNSTAALAAIADRSMDLVYTRYVLQHVPDRAAIRSYIADFMRILKPGGLLCFQLPCHVPLVNRLRPKKRLYTLLACLGIGKRFIYEKLHLFPIIMNYIPENDVVDMLKGKNGTVLDIQTDDTLGKRYRNRIYFVTKPA